MPAPTMLGKSSPEEKKSEAPVEDVSDFDSAAEDLFEAWKEGDTAAAKLALRAAIEACKAEEY